MKKLIVLILVCISIQLIAMQQEDQPEFARTAPRPLAIVLREALRRGNAPAAALLIESSKMQPDAAGMVELQKNDNALAKQVGYAALQHNYIRTAKFLLDNKLVDPNEMFFVFMDVLMFPEEHEIAEMPITAKQAERMIRLIARYGPLNLEMRNTQSMTPLLQVVDFATPAFYYSRHLSLSDRYQLAKLFLELGADIEAKAPSGERTPLILACSYKSKNKNPNYDPDTAPEDNPSQLIKLLLAHKANINVWGDGWQPLSWCLQTRSAKSIAALLNAGAKIEDRDYSAIQEYREANDPVSQKISKLLDEAARKQKLEEKPEPMDTSE